MKYFLIIALLHIISVSRGQIVISGKIKNYDGKTKVYYNPIVEGIAPPYWGFYSAIPDANGNFRITFLNKGYGTMTLSFAGIGYYFFCAENSKIKLTIDQAKIHLPEKRKTNFDRFEHFDVISIIDSLTQVELDQIKLLGLNTNSEKSGSLITNDIRNFLENEVRAFYGTTLLSGMMLKRFAQGRALLKDSVAPLTIYNREWEKLVESYLLNASKTIKPSANSHQYNEFIQTIGYTGTDYRIYNFDPPDITNDEYIVNALLKPPPPKLDPLLLNRDVILAKKLNALSVYLYTQTFYSPVLLSSIRELKSQYPDSELLARFEPQIEKLKAYLKSTAADYNKAKIVETNYLRFTDLLETFKGKNILIDVWATWCGPCVEDFAYKSSLRRFIDAGQLVTLYISIDQFRWEKRWKENMKYNQLEGYHVLANQELIISMWEYLKGKEGQIPRYALIDKNGQMILSDAARPSDGDKLAKQVENLVFK